MEKLHTFNFLKTLSDAWKNENFMDFYFLAVFTIFSDHAETIIGGDKEGWKEQTEDVVIVAVVVVVIVVIVVVVVVVVVTRLRRRK